MALAERGRLDEALAAYQRVIDDHGDAPTEPTLAHYLSAMLHKARALAELDRPEEALDSYHEVVNSYRFGLRPHLRELAVSALRESSVLLSDLGRTEEAVAAYDAVDELPMGRHRKWSPWALSNRDI